jgi:tetratricopeptide (TPR) repeat protein
MNESNPLPEKDPRWRGFPPHPCGGAGKTRVIGLVLTVICFLASARSKVLATPKETPSAPREAASSKPTSAETNKARQTSSKGSAAAADSDGAVRQANTDKTAARRFFRQGKRFFKKKQYDRAIALFKKAYARWKHRVILYNLALAHAFKKETLIAARYVHRFLKQAKGNERQLPPILEGVQRKVGSVSIRVPDSKAEIYIDGHFVGTGSAEAVFLPGRKVLELRKKDRVLKRSFITIRPGKETVWELAEMPKPRPPETKKTVQPRPRPRPRLTIPRPRPPRPPVAVTPDSAKQKKKTGLNKIHWSYFVTGLAVSLAAGGAAGGLSYKTRSLHREFQDDDTNASLADKGKRYQLASNIMWGVTASMAVTTAVLAIFTQWSADDREEHASEKPSLRTRSTKNVNWMPAVWPAGGGLRVRW